MAKELYKQLIKDIQKKIEQSEFDVENLMDVLSRGYFPAKLPPCFTTESFGNVASIYYCELLEIILKKKYK